MSSSWILFSWLAFIGIDLMLMSLSVHGEMHAFPASSSELDSDVHSGNETLKTTPIPTTPFVTLRPSKKEKYNLTLTNPGPSVLDSTLSFVAHLSTDDGSPIPPGKNFSFLWMNMADMIARRTSDNDEAVIPLVFPSDLTFPGDYTMTVVVSEESTPSKILAFQTKKFVLTENLNGYLTIEQDLEYQRLPDTFATGQAINATAVVADHFESEQDPHFEYYWYIGDQHLITTPEPQVTTTIDKPMNSSIRTLILATMLVDSFPSADNSESSREQRGLGNHGKGQGHDDKVDAGGDFSIKNGQFKQQVFFKAPLSDCFINRVDSHSTDRDIKIGNPAIINITCVGSPPTAVCLNITSYNFTALNVSEACRPQQFEDTLHHQVKVNVNQTGWNDVHFFVYNDVTRRQYTIAFYAYDPSSTNIPALVLPVVFVTLGIVVVSVGAAYIMRLRKKPLVEVADFDFHPSLTESSAGGFSARLRLSLIANSIKHLLTRQRWRDDQSRTVVVPAEPGLSEMEDSASSHASGKSVLYDTL